MIKKIHLSEQETQVLSLDQEDPLDKEMVAHSSILAWEMSWTEEHWWATVHGVAEESDMISVQFSSVMSDSPWTEHTRPLCLSPTPRVYSNSCRLSW